MLVNSIDRMETLPPQKNIAIVSVICKICFIYNNKLNTFAKLNGLRLHSSGITKDQMVATNRLYDTVSYDTVNTILDEYAADNDEHLKCFAGKDVIQVGDNVDKRQKRRHEFSGKSFKDYHMYNNLLYESRVNLSTLSDVPPAPPNSAEEVNYQEFFPSKSDQDDLVSRLTPLVAKIWSRCEGLNAGSSAHMNYPSHKYEVEMSTKSNKVCD